MSSVCAKKSALVLGATGAVGSHVLRELLASPHFDRVGEFGRHVTEKEKLSGLDVTKLAQKIIDFEKLPGDDQGLKEGKWDVVFVTLGITRKDAGTAANFEKIDREYVLNAARAARVDGLKQKVVYCSSGGANASSYFLYMRSKGLTEIGLASLGYSDAIIFRPGYLANRNGARFVGSLERMIAPITKALACLSDSVEIDVGNLGKAMVRTGGLGSEALPKEIKATREGPVGAPFTVIDNAGALRLGESE